jgi:hypothetical protein
VSPLWRDEVAIYLSPRKLVLVRRARGLKPRVVAATELAVPAAAFGDLGPVFGRLSDVLADPAWHGAAARAVLADHPWVRFGIVPWPEARLDAAGRSTHARYVLGDAHGKGVADWAVTLSDSPPGRSFVVCAVPETFGGQLEDALAPARLSLLSLQPRLVVSFNAWRHRLPADDAWFVSVDDGALSAVHLTDGAWDRVHTARLSSDWTVELERLQAFGRMTHHGSAPGRMFVDAPSWMRGDAAAGAGIEWLHEGTEDGAQAQEMALLQRMYP